MGLKLGTRCRIIRYPDTGESGESYDVELGQLRGEKNGATRTEDDENTSLSKLWNPLKRLCGNTLFAFQGSVLSQHNERRMRKIMLSLHGSQAEGLQSLADERGITIQELLRAVVIPEWGRGYGIVLNGDRKLIEKREK